MSIRINKYLSQFGFTSRREADKLILDGRVTVNNKIIQPGYKVQVLHLQNQYVLHN